MSLSQPGRFPQRKYIIVEDHDDDAGRKSDAGSSNGTGSSWGIVIDRSDFLSAAEANAESASKKSGKVVRVYQQISETVLTQPKPPPSEWSIKSV